MNRKLELKNLFRCLIAVSLIAFLPVACDDDGEEGNGLIPSELNGMYTNKQSAPEESNTLILHYSNEVFLGKEVYFGLTADNKADITLFNVLPGEKETTISSVPLQAVEDGGYSFSGTCPNQGNSSFAYNGVVTRGEMRLNIQDARILPNRLTEAGRWNIVKPSQVEIMMKPGTPMYSFFHTPCHLSWSPAPSGSLILGSLPTLGRTILGNLIGTVLKDVSFLPDGNIVAQYAALPDTLDFATHIVAGNGIADRPDSDWQSSLANLATYRVEGETLYVIPQVEMIMRLVESTKADTRSADAQGGLDMDAITNLYTQITQWCTEGLPIAIRTNPQEPAIGPSGSNERFEGDIILTLDKSHLEPFFPLFPLLKELLPAETLNQVALGDLTVGQLLDAVLDSIVRAEVFEIGLYLNEGK